MTIGNEEYFQKMIDRKGYFFSNEYTLDEYIKNTKEGLKLTIDTTILTIWSFGNAPKELQKKSQHGGDEELVFLIEGNITIKSYILIQFIIRTLDFNQSIDKIMFGNKLFITAHS